MALLRCWEKPMKRPSLRYLGLALAPALLLAIPPGSPEASWSPARAAVSPGGEASSMPLAPQGFRLDPLPQGALPLTPLLLPAQAAPDAPGLAPAVLPAPLPMLAGLEALRGTGALPYWNFRAVPVYLSVEPLAQDEAKDQVETAIYVAPPEDITALVQLRPGDGGRIQVPAGEAVILAIPYDQAAVELQVRGADGTLINRSVFSPGKKPAGILDFLVRHNPQHPH
jgi:hypothetical protein